MNADWDTVYREGCNAYDAALIVGGLWRDAEAWSGTEDYLKSVWDYLNDRGNIAMEFCNVISETRTETL